MEDGFDLSDVNAPLLDHPPLKAVSEMFLKIISYLLLMMVGLLFTFNVSIVTNVCACITSPFFPGGGVQLQILRLLLCPNSDDL